MADLSCSYMGLKLTSPLIIGSSGLSESPETISQLVDNGASAVVLKSIFEEEIYMESALWQNQQQPEKGARWEGLDYFDAKIRQHNFETYKDLISGTKKRVDVPVIASVNCLYTHEWAQFTKHLEESGADAVELNMFFSPSDMRRNAAEQKEDYFRIISEVLGSVKIPVALKISPYFADLGLTIKELSKTGISGIVLFNRFYSPDFDIENFKVISSFVFSSKQDLALSLRWVSLMSGRIECDIAASSGVHSGEDLVKQLLAGADVVQVVSAIYEKGNHVVGEMLDFLRHWMDRKNYAALSDFRGKLAQAKSENPLHYERAQFMKNFAGR